MDLTTDTDEASGYFAGAALAGGHLIWHTDGSSGGKYGPATRYSSTTRLRLSTGRREQLRTDDSNRPSLTALAATPSSIYGVNVERTDEGADTVDDVTVQRLAELRWARP